MYKRQVEGKTAWFGIDVGRETNRTIEKVVMYTPANLTLLGTMEKCKVILYGNDKNVLAEKTCSTTPSEKSTNVTSWKLDAPVKARGLRVESANPSQPLALTEVEAYGPEDAEDTPVPAPAAVSYTHLDVYKRQGPDSGHGSLPEHAFPTHPHRSRWTRFQYAGNG